MRISEFGWFQLAGGVILFLFGLQMVFGSGVLSSHAVAEPGHDAAVFPLALPGIASPGAITAVVLLTDNHRHSIAEQAVTALVLVVVLVVTFGLLHMADAIHRVLGSTGANVLVRVLGLVLSALATEQIVAGIEALLKTGTAQLSNEPDARPLSWPGGWPPRANSKAVAAPGLHVASSRRRPQARQPRCRVKVARQRPRACY